MSKKIQTNAARLAVVVSHPIQYYSPWFRDIAKRSELHTKVFYLWDFGVSTKIDPGFGAVLKWDIPLLDGYMHAFVTNVSKRPGTDSFGGLNNPKIVRSLLEFSPDVILLFGYAYRTHLRLLFSRRIRKVPILFRGDSHVLIERHGWKQRVSGLLRRVLFRRFAGALAVGKGNREYLITNGMCPERIFHAPHSVDNARFRSEASQAEHAAIQLKGNLSIDREAFVFLFVGKFEDKKRPLDLLKAFQRVRGSNPGLNVALVFVGSGALDSDLKHYTNQHAINAVHFIPFQNQSQISRVYMAGDILVLPSLGHGETWGLVVNEVMNCAKPAIVSSHVGCGPDLVMPGKTGWVFPAGDVDALAGVMLEAANDPERCKEYGANAYKHIEGYSYEATTQGLLAALESLR